MKLLSEDLKERPWATHCQRAEFLYAVSGGFDERSDGLSGGGASAQEPKNRGGMGPSLAVEGATTSRVFETYVKRLLAPALKPGQVVVMDNLGAHRPKRVRELIEARGCELIYLPPYSPDLNPIEEALSKVKHILRKICARNTEALIEAMGRVLGAVSARYVRGFFAHCGYHAPAQQL